MNEVDTATSEGDALTPDLIRILANAFGHEPSTPAAPDLGGGVAARALWSFAPSLEVVVGKAEKLPSDGQALTAWRTRLGRRPIPLVLLIEGNGSSLIVGPSGDPPPVVSIGLASIFRVGQRCP